VRFPTCAERAIYEITADLAGSVFRKSGQADGFEIFKNVFSIRALGSSAVHQNRFVFSLGLC